LCSILPRNTEVDQAGKRTLTNKNEKTGDHEGVEQRLVWFLYIILICQNLESNNAMEQTLNAICTTVAAGAVDNNDSNSAADLFKSCGYNDMGDSYKYTVKKNDKVIDFCNRLFAYCARAVCITVSGMQWRDQHRFSPCLRQRSLGHQHCRGVSGSVRETARSRQKQQVVSEGIYLHLVFHAASVESVARSHEQALSSETQQRATFIQSYAE